MTICAIHQPNFFPWAGYFDKIKQADVFIFLDEVAYPKSGSGTGSWCNRVKLLNGGVPAWFGLPIQRQSGVQLIKDVKFANQAHSLKKIVKSLEHNYTKSRYYQQAMQVIDPLLNYASSQLADYNINAIMSLSNFLGLKTKFVRQSELVHNNQSTKLLIELVQQVNADAYLCGNGAQGYQEDFLFTEAGIKLIHQNANPAQNFIEDVKQEESGLSMLHLLLAHYDQLGR